jgi:hypothetical protein
MMMNKKENLYQIKYKKNSGVTTVTGVSIVHGKTIDKAVRRFRRISSMHKQADIVGIEEVFLPASTEEGGAGRNDNKALKGW